MNLFTELSIWRQGYNEGFARACTLLQERANAMAAASAQAAAPSQQQSAATPPKSEQPAPSPLADAANHAKRTYTRKKATSNA